MQLHNLQPKHKSKTRKRIGRGGKRGTYSGRGMKGQKSRAGTRKGQPAIRELIKRYHKLKGYRSNPLTKTAVINLSQLEKHFKSGDKITPKVLLDKGLIAKIKGREPRVKILGNGEISKNLIFEDVAISLNAKKKIAKVCGSKKSS